MNRRASAAVRPLVIGAVAVAMLARTRGTWPDPLVDYGTHLYTPWQVSLGRVLYRDVAFYSGPLSTYVNAGLFRLFGVGLHTLEVANGLVLTAMMALAYRLARRASGPTAAVAGGVVFALVFAFGQGVELGNYNWVTPYNHELTHGVLLAAVAIAAADRFARTDRLRWAAAAGTALGALLLTRVEPAVAGLAAVTVQLAATAWTTRAPARRTGVAVAAVVGPAAAVVLAAVVAFSCAMPVGEAGRCVLGSWRWAFDRRITGLAFYRRLVGLDDVPGHLPERRPVVGRLRRGPVGDRRPGRAAGVGRCDGRGRGRGHGRRLRPDLLAVGAGPAAVVPGRGGRAGDGGRRAASPRGTAAAHARRLLAGTAGQDAARRARLPLRVRAGAAGTLVAVAVLADDLPAWVDRRGGRGAVVRAVGLVVTAAFVAFTLIAQAPLLASKQWTVAGGGPDSFVASGRGLEVAAVVDWIDHHVPPGGTVAVMPQGLMVNYLARRAAPTRYGNLMPPEVIAAGEPAVVAALAARPAGRGGDRHQRRARRAVHVGRAVRLGTGDGRLGAVALPRRPPGDAGPAASDAVRLRDPDPARERHGWRLTHAPCVVRHWCGRARRSLSPVLPEPGRCLSSARISWMYPLIRSSFISWLISTRR